MSLPMPQPFLFLVCVHAHTCVHTFPNAAHMEIQTCPVLVPKQSL